ncbi:cytidine and deoxycytidylate deaminase zinc-binding region [Diplocarpon rosae]|nr:cytidine and deoxycytidylate deaminase zinc-binding region [Diplocarpon rosae]
MLYPRSIPSLLLLAMSHLSSGHEGHARVLPPASYTDTIPFATRVFWMRRAIDALGELDSPCPFAAFGTVIVNHTDLSGGPHGRAICHGVNSSWKTGNPTLHGEISGINNCSRIFTDPAGEYRMSPTEALAAFSTLSLYTNAEPCPMCASAIRWSGFAECIFGTSIATLIAKGWSQIDMAAEEVFVEAGGLPSSTRLVQKVLTNETDPYFLWQYDEAYPCPRGCERTSRGSSCTMVVREREAEEL